MRIIDVDQKNVSELGFFCLMSQKKAAGYQRKLRWLEDRFAEGLKIKMLDLSEGGRGFIEYIPGEYAWRPVDAAGYLFIHCLWIVGKSKGKGYAKLLLDACIADARRQKKQGIAMLTSEGNWLVSKKLLLRQGFESVDRAPPAFELLVKRFGRATLPSMPDDWEKRAKKFGKGLTVVRSDQCPYLEGAARTVTETAQERGLKAKTVELESAQEIRNRAPSPLGVFSVVLDGAVISHHHILKKTLVQHLDDRR